MRSAERTAGSPPATASAIFLVSVLLAANLAIVGPRTLYTANATEFAASYWSVLWMLVVATAAITVVLVVLQCATPRRVRSRAVVLVFSLAVLAWIQGNWLVGNFGLLDGDALDFDAEAGGAARDTVLWIGGIVVAQLFHRALAPHVRAIAGIFLAVQLLALPFDLESRDRSSTAPAPALIADDAIFEFSSGTNIVLLILDNSTSDTLSKFIDQDREAYAEAFSGFTVYADNLGAFPWTQYSVPAMLGAQPFDNRVPSDDYMSDSLKNETITGPLLEAGWRVDWISAWPLFCAEGLYTNCFSIPRPYTTPELRRAQLAAQLLDLSLFRHAPYPLKPVVYRGGSWIAQAALWREFDAPVFTSSAVAFFRDFTKRAFVGRSEPTFKILHTAGGHLPAVVDADCNEVPKRSYTNANYEQLMRCSLKQTRALFDQLRKIGVYDEALIVVAGDHGSKHGALGRGSHGLDPVHLSRARPLLAVKWPSSEPGLRVSDAPVSILDIAPTIAASAGVATAGPGRNLADLEGRAVSARQHAIYVQRRGTPGGFVERFERYTVAPGSLQPTAWKFDSVVFSPVVDLPAREITVGDEGFSDHFSFLGWGGVARTADGTPFLPAFGPRASFFVTLPRGRDAELELRLRAPAEFRPQTIEAMVGGVVVATLHVREEGFADHAIAIPGRLVRDRVTAVELRAANSQRSARGRRPSAFELERIRVRGSETGGRPD